MIASDHGDYAGEKGPFSKSESLYDCLLHVPLIIRPPDNSDGLRGIPVDGLVSLVDLFPTILYLAGIEPPPYVQGFDLVSWVAEDATVPLPSCVFAQVGDYHGSLKTTFPTGLPKSGRRKSPVQGARSMTWAYL